MRCGLCGFLIIKSQTTLHYAVWCGAVHYYLQCGAVMPFCGWFWCGFCGLCSSCNLVNTPSHHYSRSLPHQYSQRSGCIIFNAEGMASMPFLLHPSRVSCPSQFSLLGGLAPYPLYHWCLSLWGLDYVLGILTKWVTPTSLQVVGSPSYIILWILTPQK